WNVKSRVWPVPSGETSPDAGIAAHVYVHGKESHDDALASKCTVSPVTGSAGEYVNAAVSGSATAETGGVAPEAAAVEPRKLVAVTTTRIVEPTSAAVSR